MLKRKSRVNSKAKAKPRGKPFTGRDDPRVNLKGAPKRGESWTEIIKRYGEMTPGEAAQESMELARKLLSIGEGVTLKQAVVLRVYAALLFEPQASLLNAFLDRAEGTVTKHFEHSGPDGGPITIEQLSRMSERELNDLLSGLFARASTSGAGTGGAPAGGEGAPGGAAAAGHGPPPRAAS